MMQAIAKAKAEPGLWLEQAPVPKIRGDDVLIRVLKSSICETDVHIYNWDAWAQKTIPVPMTIGHEFVGVVELRPPKNLRSRAVARIAVCLDQAVPVASDPWHGLVWVKVLAR
jgi:threonine dehydrogenase-like Zn-dependent dehydrogenase